jgi:hypothetical protein
MRYIKHPTTGRGLWQKYVYASGEFVEDIFTVQAAILYGMDVDGNFAFLADIETVTKAVFDDRVRDLEDMRLQSSLQIK